jgi:hypothetical protein
MIEEISKELQEISNKIDDKDIIDLIKHIRNNPYVSITDYLNELDKKLKKDLPVSNTKFSYSSKYLQTYTVMLNTNSSIHVNISPFNNCQIYTIGGFEKVIDLYSSFHNIKELLIYIRNYITAKALLNVDVNQNYCERIDKLFEKRINTKVLFTSTNGSPRCLYLLNVHEL